MFIAENIMKTITNFDKMKEMKERKYTKYYEKVHNQWKSYST